MHLSDEPWAMVGPRNSDLNNNYYFEAVYQSIYITTINGIQNTKSAMDNSYCIYNIYFKMDTRDKTALSSPIYD